MCGMYHKEGHRPEVPLSCSSREGHPTVLWPVSPLSSAAAAPSGPGSPSTHPVTHTGIQIALLNYLPKVCCPFHIAYYHLPALLKQPPNILWSCSSKELSTLCRVASLERRSTGTLCVSLGSPRQWRARVWCEVLHNSPGNTRPHSTLRPVPLAVLKHSPVFSLLHL